VPHPSSRHPGSGLRVLTLVLLSTPLALTAATTSCREKVEDEKAAKSNAPLATVADCNGILASAGAAVGLAVHKANPPGKSVCAKDDDCVEVAPASCVKVCFGHGVPKGAAGEFAKDMRSIDESHCKRWNEGQCLNVLGRPPGGCVPAHPRCEEGICKMVPVTK
jgi:hypothetical protein